MKIENIKISELYPQIADHGAYITTYFTEKSPEINFGKRPAMIVYPGGGYWMTSDREAEPIALKFASAGYQVIVVRYSTKDKAKDANYPQQLLEGMAAIDYMRKHADELNVDPSKLAVIGFSAGGHMAGMMGTLYGEKVVCDTFNVGPRELRPDAMVLSYPVLTSGKFSHGGSLSNLLGEDAANDPEMRKKVDIIENVTEDTPPAFIWTTFTDGCVPAQNSLMMAGKMLEVGVKCELHMFRDMWHGASLADRTVASKPEDVNGISKPHIAHWVGLCMEWLGEEFKY